MALKEFNNGKIKKNPSVSNIKEIKKLKILIAEKISEKYNLNLKGTDSSLENSSKSHRFVLSVSRFRNDRVDKYWYRYDRRHIDYLSEVNHGYFVLGCLDSKKSFAIPKKDMDKLEKTMKKTIDKDSSQGQEYHYHVFVRLENDRHYIYIHNPKQEFDISEFEIKPSKNKSIFSKLKIFIFWLLPFKKYFLR